MNEKLLKRLQDGEDNFTERKPESAGNSDWKRTMVAFANSVPEDRTAVLFIGVADDGKIKGVNNTDSIQKSIRNICKQKCYPPIEFQSEVLTIEDKKVVAIEISESFSRPHFAGPAYVREGSESVVASERIYEDLITSRTDTGRAILKHNGEDISVITYRKRLGKIKNLGNGTRFTYKCRIESCNPHYVTLYEYATGQMIVEPLKNVTVSFDHEHKRFQLDIEPK